MKEKLGIILLNYKNYKDTIDCIKSIQSQDYDNYEIIVVDNNSQNESVEKIKIFIEEKRNIHLIESKENLGFAKGNNIGIRFARNKLKCDFVFVLNSDTILDDKTILQRLIDSYQKDENIAVINPVCCNVDREIQMPYLVCDSRMWKYCLKTGKYLIKQYLKIKFNIRVKKNKEKMINISQIEKNKYIIQGCAYILTPEFFRYYSQIYPETFLYCEEMALAIYLEKAKLKTIINKEVIIIHKEGGSSSEIINDQRKKRLKYQVQSYFKVLKLLKYSYNTIKNFFDVYEELQ